MDEILKNVANLGFPIVVAVYLLMRMEGKIEQLTSSITSLSNAIEHNMLGEK